MIIRKNRYKDLVYDGDWHRPLLGSLNLAENEAFSEAFRKKIGLFREEVLMNDECFHRVTVKASLPSGLSYEFALHNIKKVGTGEDISVEFIAPSLIALTLGMRGSHSHAEHSANSILSRGINMARTAIEVSLMQCCVDFNRLRRLDETSL